MASKQLVADILSGASRKLAKDFRDMPLANKILELEKAIVEPKKSDTPTLLGTVVKQLVSQGAIYPDEASAVYGRLLTRLVKFNSLRNHNNLASLVEDVQQGQRSVVLSSLSNVPAMSNMVVLQNFLNTLPKTVSAGQQNYDAFKQLLREFVIEYNQFLEVYKSGTDTFLQYNFGPQVQKVNLTQAFNNLSNLWGAKVTNEASIPSLTALLQPQSRFLILLLSPIAMEGYFIRDSFISYLITLYKNTVAPPLKGQPVQELGNVIASLGPGYDQLKLRQGLNYIVTNQPQEYRPEVPDLTKEEEALLRYIQTLLKTKIAGTNKRLSERDLDNVLMNLNPAAFSGQIDFINKLFDYFRKVIKARPDLMTQIIYDKDWIPPPAFFYKDVLLPEDLVPVPAPRRVATQQEIVPFPSSTETRVVASRETPSSTALVPAGPTTVALPGPSTLPVGPAVVGPVGPASLPSSAKPALPAPPPRSPELQAMIDKLAFRPIPKPRRIFPNIRQKPLSGVPYRSPLPLYYTDESTDAESDAEMGLVPYRPNARSKKRVHVDVQSLTSQFKNLKGKGVGLDSLILNDLRQRARNINVRPY